MGKVDRMGVYVLSAHLIITLTLIVIYTIFALNGQDVSTIEMILIAIVGYWFGAVGNSALRPNSGTTVNHANEVKVGKTDDEQKGDK